MHSFLLMSTLVLNSVFPFCKLLVSEFLISISDTLLCSMSALQVKIVPLLDVHQLLMLSAGMLTYLEPETFTLIIFYNMLQLLLLLLLLLILSILSLLLCLFVCFLFMFLY
jgi:hypothetical protein